MYYPHPNYKSTLIKFSRTTGELCRLLTNGTEQLKKHLITCQHPDEYLAALNAMEEANIGLAIAATVGNWHLLCQDAASAAGVLDDDDSTCQEWANKETGAAVYALIPVLDGLSDDAASLPSDFRQTLAKNIARRGGDYKKHVIDQLDKWESALNVVSNMIATESKRLSGE